MGEQPSDTQENGPDRGAPDEDLLPPREIVFTDMLRFPKILGYASLAYVGIGLIAAPFLDIPDDWTTYLAKFGLPLVGSVVFVTSLMLLQAEIRKRRGFQADRFVDVDERSRNREASYSSMLAQLATSAELDSLRSAYSPHAAPRKEEIEVRNFVAYFHMLRSVLEGKAAIADEKASILLDKGVAYSRYGILFFILSIVFWQLLAWDVGFQQQHVFGIVSCSLLFIFIEFLSAWFLKQYRHFVDTSTYLIKVKSIFDRFMLSYLAAEDFEHDGTAVLELLRDEIKWPDSYLFKSADAMFAREAFEALSDLIKAMGKDKK